MAVNSVKSHVRGWSSVTVGDGIDAQGPTTRIQQAYTALELATTLPTDCAVFSFYDLGANVETIYFSPSALQLGKSFGATPCEPPENKEGFGMLIGSQSAWSQLFHQA